MLENINFLTYQLSHANLFKMSSRFVINSSLFCFSINSRTKLCSRFQVMVDLLLVLVLLVVEKLILGDALDSGITKICLYISSTSNNDRLCL